MGGCLSACSGTESSPVAVVDSSTTKLYAKNQIVPVSTSQGWDGREDQRATCAVDEAFDSKGIKAGVLKELLELCSCSPSQMSKLHRGLQSISRKLTGHLKSQSASSLPPPAVKAVALACAVCIDRMLQPVLTDVDRSMSHGAATSSMGDGHTWESVNASTLLEALEASCRSTFSKSTSELCQPLGTLLEALGLLKQHAERCGLKLQPSCFQAPSVNQLVAMLGITFFRRVVLESHSALQAKYSHIQQLLQQLGWSRQQLAAALDARGLAMMVYLQQGSEAGELRVNFTVSRSQAFWEALLQAQDQGLLSSSPQPTSQACKVFPSFVDEHAEGRGGGRAVVEAGEGHGPRKEFFEVAARSMVGLQQQGNGGQQGPQARGSRPALLLYNRTAGAYWYNTSMEETPELEQAYQFAGWLLGQSLMNKAPLGLPLPPLLFQQLLQGSAFKPDLSTLEEFDPDAANSIKNVASLSKSELQAMLEMEGLSTSLTSQQYIQHAVQKLLVEEVQWQAQGVAKGFFSAVGRGALDSWGLDARGLAAVLSGAGGDEGGEVEVQRVFKVVVDEELSGPSAVLVELLWKVLDSWPKDRKMQFVEFVTGTSRLPLAGTELLKIEAPFVAYGMNQHKNMLGMLPQAHTCDNLLELPNYWESLLQVRGHKSAEGLSSALQAALKEECTKILDDRLSIATTMFSGYALDVRDSGDDGRGPVGEGVVLHGCRASRGSADQTFVPSPEKQQLIDLHRSLLIDLAEGKDQTLVRLSYQSLGCATPMALDAPSHSVYDRMRQCGHASGAPAWEEDTSDVAWEKDTSDVHHYGNWRGPQHCGVSAGMDLWASPGQASGDGCAVHVWQGHVMQGSHESPLAGCKDVLSSASRVSSFSDLELPGMVNGGSSFVR